MNTSHGKICDFVFISIICFHFNHKTEEFWFWKSLKYFNTFWWKEWCQICPVKQCLIWFKLCWLSRTFTIISEIQISNFFELVYYFSIKEFVFIPKFVPVFHCLICIFWNYCRISFKLKKFLMILRYIEIIYWKFFI